MRWSIHPAGVDTAHFDPQAGEPKGVEEGVGTGENRRAVLVYEKHWGELLQVSALSSLRLAVLGSSDNRNSKSYGQLRCQYDCHVSSHDDECHL
jgi:hypothetical protein